MKTDLMNIIFGMKVRKARMDMDMSLSAFAKACALSPSYLTEIEKGRKYPKRDKILSIAEVTGKDYDELVSIRLAPSLKYLESALQSPLLSEFPFEEFGVQLGSLVDVLTTAPDKTSALISALFEIGRRYDMKEEHFLRAAMRSLQEMYDNHFPEIEEAAEACIEEYDLEVPLKMSDVQRILVDEYKYEIDLDALASDHKLSGLRSVVMKGRRPRLLLNSKLAPGQLAFLMAREIGHRKLGLKDRGYTSPPLEVGSFDEVLNNFKASYFAGALMMPREEIIADIEAFFGQETFQPDRLTRILDKYEASPEMLCYRWSELIPQYFGLDLHFLRFNDQGNRYRIVKQLKMNNLPLPSGFGLDEHYCRRWLTVRLLNELKSGASKDGQPHVGAQMSTFLGTDSRFLCFGFSRPLALSPGVNTSVILGFRVTPDLQNTIRFADDPEIPQTVITDACERCPLTYEQCNLRAAEPRTWNEEERLADRKSALQKLLAGMRS